MVYEDLRGGSIYFDIFPEIKAESHKRNFFDLWYRISAKYVMMNVGAPQYRTDMLFVLIDGVGLLF